MGKRRGKVLASGFGVLLTAAALLVASLGACTLALGADLRGAPRQPLVRFVAELGEQGLLVDGDEARGVLEGAAGRGGDGEEEEAESWGSGFDGWAWGDEGDGEGAEQEEAWESRSLLATTRRSSRGGSSGRRGGTRGRGRGRLRGRGGRPLSKGYLRSQGIRGREARIQQQRRRPPRNPSWMRGKPIQEVKLPASEEPLPGPICRRKNITKCKPHSNPYLNGEMQMLSRKDLYAMAYESEPSNPYKKPKTGPTVTCETSEDCKHLGKLCVDGECVCPVMYVRFPLSLSLSLSLCSVNEVRRPGRTREKRPNDGKTQANRRLTDSSLSFSLSLLCVCVCVCVCVCFLLLGTAVRTTARWRRRCLTLGARAA